MGPPVRDPEAAHLQALTRKVEAETRKIAAETAAARFALHRDRLLLRVSLLAIGLIVALALVDPATLQTLSAGGLLVVALGYFIRR
jgi:hypothetical protein